jgi:hypothetical protein
MNSTETNMVFLPFNESDIDSNTIILRNWTSQVLIGCFSWIKPNHFLFQVANSVLLIGLLAPDGKRGVLFMHGFFVLGKTLNIS